MPSSEEKDLRQLLIHRYKLVRMRAQVKNGLQHLAMNQGVTEEAEVVERRRERRCSASCRWRRGPAGGEKTCLR